MLKTVRQIVVLMVLITGGFIGARYYQTHFTDERRIVELQQQLDLLQQQRDELARIVERLNAEQRVAKVLVLDQKRNYAGVVKTTLLWVEYAHDGSTLPPRQFVITGNEAHFDAEVIKFEHDFVEKDDPLKGKSIALFTRVYGSEQTPADGFPIDPPGEVPDIYRSADAQVSAFEQELWRNFWRLYDDESYRKLKGVRIAQGESPWGKFETGQLYIITVEANGGVDLTHEPIDPIYVEAIQRRAATQPSTQPLAGEPVNR
jgi:cell division protein FtsB